MTQDVFCTYNAFNAKYPGPPQFNTCMYKQDLVKSLQLHHYNVEVRYASVCNLHKCDVDLFSKAGDILCVRGAMMCVNV